MVRNLLNTYWRAVCLGNLASTVRRGVIGKVLLDSNSLVAYPTWGRAAILALCFRSGLVVVSAWLPAVKGVPEDADAGRYENLNMNN